MILCIKCLHKKHSGKCLKLFCSCYPIENFYFEVVGTKKERKKEKKKENVKNL